jgi:hypothetical protein
MLDDPGQGRNAMQRRYFIGGSDARIIMGTDEAALLRLWREKRGEVEPEELSGNLIVQLGLVTEELNRRWYEANTGEVVTDMPGARRCSPWLGLPVKTISTRPTLRRRPTRHLIGRPGRDIAGGTVANGSLLNNQPPATTGRSA